MTTLIKQIGVIPYQDMDGQLQIMVVTARRSNGTFWTTPKGNFEPGLTDQEVAAMEAAEEAGVKGVVEDGPFGVYHYQKYQQDYEVTIYLLRIETVLEPPQWLEHDQRQRRLLPAKEASAKMANTELGALIAEFARTRG